MWSILRYSMWILSFSLMSSLSAQEQSVTIVQGRSVTLHANSVGALSYLWLRNGDPINGFHDPSLTVTLPGTYHVIALGQHCDSDMSDPVNVILDPDSPPAAVDMMIRGEPDRPTVVLGFEFTYQVLIQNSGENTATGVMVEIDLPDGIKYNDIFGAYPGSVTHHAASNSIIWRLDRVPAGGSEILQVSLVANRSGVLSKVATVVSSEEDQRPHNNESVSSIEVIAVKIPNVFTPNGDGVNDTFEIRGLELFDQAELTVYNRHGVSIYQSDHYANNWDATSIGEGTYYYVLRVRMPDQQWEVLKGYITVLRNQPAASQRF